MTIHHLGLQMHMVAALGLLYLIWQWVRTADDFSRGTVRFQIWWSRDEFAYQLVDNPARFRVATAIKLLILIPLTVIFSMLLVAR